MNTTLLLRGSNPAVSTGNKACDKFVVAFGAKVFAARFTVQKSSVSEDFLCCSDPSFVTNAPLEI